MESHQSAKIVMLLGATLLIGGIIWNFWGEKLSFIGRLPGDIRIEKENFKFYFPITTMLLLSLFVNIVLRVVKYFFQ